jgi:hypothetical protein
LPYDTVVNAGGNSRGKYPLDKILSCVGILFISDPIFPITKKDY